MKREIKFRAWDKTHNYWDDDFAIHANGCLYQPAKARWDISDIAVETAYDELEIMQFTGLKDKNRKEIYSDDILSDGINKFRVYAMYGGFSIKAPHWSDDMSEIGVGDDLIMQPLSDAQTMSYIAQSTEVIGNIWQNPELINK